MFLPTTEQQQGYTLVLDYAQQQSPVLYAQPSQTSPRPYIDAYNVKSGVRRSSGPAGCCA